MKIPLTFSHLISMSQIIYMKDPTRTDSKNSSYFLPLNTYPEYNRPIQENILYNTYLYTFFPLKIFSYPLLYSISAPRPAYITIQAHLSHGFLPRCISMPHFSTFRRTFRTVPLLLFRFPISPLPPPSFEAMGASSGVQAIIPSGWNSIGTTEMAQGSWPMA